ncbi:DUF4124 domain-containing protein [Ectothiorhodospira shaposhnikovii]|uniref:DUF4124 domain-containing protein n=1 Tax=Ectothiorhodospira shaposhnikovii TaxID=1054 RepID=UPI0039A2426C
MPLLPLLLLLLLPAQPAHAQIYHWIDEQGRTTFGDTPPEGVEARPVHVEQPTTTPGLPEIRRTPTAPDETAEREAAETYQQLSISSPENAGVVRTNIEQVSVALHLTPELQTDKGHRIRIRLDGNATTITQTPRTTLQNVTPGTHTLQAEILDRDGNVLIRSETTTFHLLRTTVQQQSRPRAP